MNKNIELPLFGNITLEETDWEYKYTADIDQYSFDGLFISLDVNFQQLSEDNISTVGRALLDLKKISQLGTDFILQNFAEAGEAKGYIDEWHQDIFEQIFTEKEFEEFLQDTDKSKSIEEQLLSKLRLIRVGIYAEEVDSFIVLDYAFGDDIDKGFLDDMLVLKMNQQYQVCEITTEG